jgi:hypothetical protein
LDTTFASKSVCDYVEVTRTPQVVLNACGDEAPGILFLFGSEFAIGCFEFAEDDASRWD